MSKIDFSKQDSAIEWFSSQAVQVCCAISSRNALRVQAITRLKDGDLNCPLILSYFRAVLTSSARCKSSIADVPMLEEAARIMLSKGFSETVEMSSEKAVQSAAHSVSGLTENDLARASFFSIRSAAESTSSGVIFEMATLDAANELIIDLNTPLWNGMEVPDAIVANHVLFLEKLAAHPDWAFWRSWYLAMWEGTEIDWDFATEVAKISDDVWEEGFEAVAAEIRRIQDNRQPSDKDPAKATTEVSETERQAIKHAAGNNRDALVWSVAGLLEQLAAFRERVRGLNHLESEFREDLLEFIDDLSDKLESLLHNLPEDDKELEDKQANTLVLWLREFRPLISLTAAKYVAPQNVAEAAVPTGIILGCTAVGALVGGPAGGGVGALVGGLVTGHVKPGKAAEELTKQDPE